MTDDPSRLSAIRAQAHQLAVRAFPESSERSARAVALADKIVDALQAEIDTLSSRIKQLEALEQLHVDILHNRADDLTKAACDECEQCGEAVMCSYHSVLSELARQVEMPQQ
jgi:septal ring factor EnvC (AmiA/AmiB activator)